MCGRAEKFQEVLRVLLKAFRRFRSLVNVRMFVCAAAVRPHAFFVSCASFFGGAPVLEPGCELLNREVTLGASPAFLSLPATSTDISLSPHAIHPSAQLQLRALGGLCRLGGFCPSLWPYGHWVFCLAAMSLRPCNVDRSR